MVEFNIREIQFPTMPNDVSDEMRDYLVELERVLKDSLKGSIYIEKIFEDGIFGN